MRTAKQNQLKNPENGEASFAKRQIVLVVVSAFSICLLALVSGCGTVVSIHPLYTPVDIEQPKLDSRLEGEWVMTMPSTSKSDYGKPETPCRAKIKKSNSEEGAYSFELPNIDEPPDGPATCDTYARYSVRLVPLGNALFYDAQFDESKDRTGSHEASEIIAYGAAPGHFVGQTWVLPEMLRVSLLNPETWPDEDKIKTELGHEGSVTAITSRTSVLREWMSLHAGDYTVFGTALYLCRAGRDCTARAVEDQLSRTPDDFDTLTDAVEFYAMRGEYIRALQLQRQKINLDSDPTDGNLKLGELLLLDRQYVDARTALAAGKDSESGQFPRLGDLVVRSFFVMGDYEGTIKAAKTLPRDARNPSADPAILAYFAMLRLGRKAEATEYLKQQAESFVGSEEEKMYLFKVAESPVQYAYNKDPNRLSYYKALQYLSDEKNDAAEAELSPLATKLPKNDPSYFAATMELERLGRPARQ